MTPEEKNLLLFKQFGAVFRKRDDPAEFAQFAARLASWLDNRRAYYLAARPEIIRLLLAAEGTVRGVALNVEKPELNTPFYLYDYPEHPIFKPYILLVQTVAKYKDCFEPAFKEFIARAEASIKPPAGHPALTTMNPAHVSGSGPSQPRQTVAQPSSDPDIQIIENPFPPAATHLIQPFVPAQQAPPLSASSETMSTPAAQASTIRTRKVKKKKTLDFEALVQADIDSLLKDKKAQSGDNTALKVDPSVNSPQIASASHTPILGAQAATQTQHPGKAAPDAQPLAGPSTARVHQGSPIVQSPLPAIGGAPPSTGIHPRPGSIDCGIQHVTGTTANAPTQPVVHDTPMEVDSHPMVESNNTVQTSASVPATPAIGSGPQNPVIAQITAARSSSRQTSSQPAASREATMQPQGTTPRPSSRSEPAPMDVDNQNQPHSMAMDVDVNQSATSNITSPGIQNARVQSSEPPSSTLPVPQARNVPSSSTSTPPRPPPVASPHEKRAASHQKSPASNADTETAQAVSATIQSSIKSMTLTSDQTTGDTFAGCSMRVIAIQRGQPKGSRITINFDIEKEKFMGIALWNSRQIGQKPHVRDLENTGICISLGCYSTEQLAAQRQKEGCDTIEKQLSALRSSWPTGGFVSIDVMFEGQRADLPLSPPFQVTPDNFVDISQFANEGPNVVQLSHQRDMSRFTFVLLVHHPTQAQLKQVKNQRQKDSEWASWVTDLTKPFNIPLQSAA